MVLMDIITYLSAILIGIILGLIGGGGSILTVPFFVYFLGINPITATAYSLFVVGTSALFGAISNYKRGLVNIRTTITFSIPAIIAVYITRKYILPNIPEELYQINNFYITKDSFIMIMFAIIMLLAALSMIRNKNDYSKSYDNKKYNYLLISIEGIIVGFITGIVGAGGGFIIIPALVILGKLPIKEAIGTSLAIISLKSLLGFTGDIQETEINWYFLLLFTFFSVIGIFIGVFINKRINSKKMKKIFGYIVFFAGIYILLNEFF